MDKYGDKVEFYTEMEKRGEDTPLDHLKKLSYLESLYFKDFKALGTQRQNGMGLGPIPVNDIVKYALLNGILDIPLFKKVILAVDEGYLKQKYLDQKQKDKQNASKRKND